MGKVESCRRCWRGTRSALGAPPDSLTSYSSRRHVPAPDIRRPPVSRKCDVWSLALITSGESWVLDRWAVAVDRFLGRMQSSTLTPYVMVKSAATAQRSHEIALRCQCRAPFQGQSPSPTSAAASPSGLSDSETKPPEQAMKALERELAGVSWASGHRGAAFSVAAADALTAASLAHGAQQRCPLPRADRGEARECLAVP